MGYESLSSVVLVAIAALLMFVWAPRKARRGMKRASEHRADRFSASLHLVDESSATRFNDTTPPITKGLLMQAEQQRKASRLTPQKVARVRRLRREAIRRRRILVGALLAASAVVLVLAFVLTFSPLFALIPFGLMVLVLGLGAHAAAQARAWEAEVAAMARRGAGAAQVLPQTVGKAARPTSDPRPARTPAAQPAHPTKPAQPTKSAQVRGEGPDTDVMMASEIRDVLERDRIRREAEKASGAGMAGRGAKAASADAAGGIDHAGADRSTAGRTDRAGAESAKVAESAHASVRPGPDVAADADDVARQARAVAAAEPEDATNELERISPSHALDAFEMAASQDLISFTLGAPRGGRPAKQAGPESLEIKSTRQVARAVPVAGPHDGAKAVKSESAPEAAKSARSERSGRTESQPAAPERRSDDAQADDARSDKQTSKSAESAAPARSKAKRSQSRRSFHDAELHRAVEAPAASADSLGVDVDAVIARRGH